MGRWCAELAEAVGRVFVVSTTAESMRRAAEAKPDKYVMATKGGTLATEEALEKVAGASLPFSLTKLLPDTPGSTSALHCTVLHQTGASV